MIYALTQLVLPLLWAMVISIVLGLVLLVTRDADRYQCDVRCLRFRGPREIKFLKAHLAFNCALCVLVFLVDLGVGLKLPEGLSFERHPWIHATLIGFLHVPLARKFARFLEKHLNLSAENTLRYLIKAADGLFAQWAFAGCATRRDVEILKLALRYKEAIPFLYESWKASVKEKLGASSLKRINNQFEMVAALCKCHDIEEVRRALELVEKQMKKTG